SWVLFGSCEGTLSNRRVSGVDMRATWDRSLPGAGPFHAGWVAGPCSPWHTPAAMDFYYGRMSGNSSRAALGLAETRVAYQPHVLDTHRGENRAAAYLAVNPMGKIPALVDGELILWESNAINWYLAEKFPQARLLPQS